MRVYSVMMHKKKKLGKLTLLITKEFIVKVSESSKSGTDIDAQTVTKNLAHDS